MKEQKKDKASQRLLGLVIIRKMFQTKKYQIQSFSCLGIWKLCTIELKSKSFRKLNLTNAHKKIKWLTFQVVLLKLLFNIKCKFSKIFYNIENLKLILFILCVLIQRVQLIMRRGRLTIGLSFMLLFQFILIFFLQKYVKKSLNQFLKTFDQENYLCSYCYSCS